MENFMRGDSKMKPSWWSDSHGDMTYDRMTDMRHDVQMINPSLHSDHTTIKDRTKLQASRLKKIADDIGNIPLSMVMDAIDDAAHNVSILTRRNLNAPPVPVSSIRKEKVSDTNEENVPRGFLQPFKNIKIFEIWKVFLETKIDKVDFVYIVLSSDYMTQGYKDGEWTNIQYRGFYTTFNEAKNQISGYLR